MGYHVRVSPPGAGFIDFDTLADLAAFQAMVFVDGVIVFVSTPATYWNYAPASTATPDGASVVAATGGGNWLLKDAVGLEPVVSVLAFGAIADGVMVADGNITATLSDLTTTSSTPFTANSVGKSVNVAGAGAAGADLITTIATFVSSSHVTLNAAATTTVVNATVVSGTDNQPAFQRAANALAGTGVAMGILSGSFATFSRTNMPNGLLVRGSPEATVLGGGDQSNPLTWIFSCTQGPITATTTLSVAPTKGIPTLNVASAAGLVVGSTVYAARVGGLITQQFTILKIVGTTVTTDDPVEFGFQIGDTLTQQTAPSYIRFYGNGLTLAGRAYRGFEMYGAYRCTVSDVVCTNLYIGGSFDDGGRDNIVERVSTSAYALAASAFGWALECNVRSTIKQCRAQGHAGGIGYWIPSGARILITESAAWECLQGLNVENSGVAGDLDSVQRSTVSDCSFYSNGIGTVCQGTQDVEFLNCNINYNTTENVLIALSLFAIVPNTNLSFVNCAIDSSPAGHNISVTGAGHNFTCSACNLANAGNNAIFIGTSGGNTLAMDSCDLSNAANNSLNMTGGAGNVASFSNCNLNRTVSNSLNIGSTGCFVKVTNCRMNGGASAGNAIAISGTGHSIDVANTSMTGGAVPAISCASNNNAIRLADVDVSGNSVIAISLSGTGCTLAATNITANTCKNGVLSFGGANSSAVIDGLFSDDGNTNGGAALGVVLVNASATCTIKGARLRQTANVSAACNLFNVTGGAFLNLDDVEMDYISGAGNVICLNVTGVSNTRIRNCRTAGALNQGIKGNNGVASTLRVQDGNNFQSCTTPTTYDGTIMVSKGTVTANGVTPVAVSFTDISPATEKVLLTPTASAGLAFVSAKLAGIGFLITSTAGDTQVYDYVIQ